MDDSAPKVGSGMMLKAKLAPHLLHDHEWDQMADDIQPKRLFDTGATPAPATPMRPAVSATDGNIDARYQRPTTPGQQGAIVAERNARLDPKKTATPGYSPVNAAGVAKIQTTVAPGVVAGVGGPTSAPRREATNPLTGDEGQDNQVASGPLTLGSFGGGRRSFTNPTSAGIYADHVQKLFAQPRPLQRTPLRGVGIPR